MECFLEMTTVEEASGLHLRPTPLSLSSFGVPPHTRIDGRQRLQAPSFANMRAFTAPSNPYNGLQVGKSSGKGHAAASRVFPTSRSLSLRSRKADRLQKLQITASILLCDQGLSSSSISGGAIRYTIGQLDAGVG